MPRSALGILVVGLLGASVAGSRIAEAVEVAKIAFLGLTVVMSGGLLLGLARRPSAL